MGKQLFENITENEYLLLEWILKNPKSVPADYFFIDPTVDGRVEELVRANMISLNPQVEMEITELGRAALVERDELLKKSRKNWFGR